VVRLMAEGKYLHEYCNFDLGYQIAKGIVAYNVELTGEIFPQKQWLEIVRNCVLLTT
jgi:hypothetical protein